MNFSKKLSAVGVATALFLCLITTLEPLFAQDTNRAHYFPLPERSGEIIESEDQSFYLQVVAEGLENPWGAAFLPDGTILITERDTGKIRIIKNGELQSGSLNGVPEVNNRNQGGLLDIAIHPDFQNNQLVYFAYSRPVSGNNTTTALARARLNDMNLEDKEIIFEGGPESNRPFHYGNRIVFDNDGYLFFAIGDRGDMSLAQDLSNHAGKTFRLYDDGRIPSDNPFTAHSNAQPEIFSFGNRNIQGMTMHPGTGEIWSNEHGPRGGDEINIIRSGNNYGWPKITHGVNYNGSIITPDTAAPGMEQPFHHWTPSIAVSGMAIIYNNEHYPRWHNSVFNGALAGQHLNRVVISGDTPSFVKEERLLSGIGRIREVLVAPDGYLYILEESNGRLIRILPAS
ncbi:MAG: PQQ-dependent sugar dehydrogenase [Balneolales bacterium]|nr:PQQ-dependent sugar dehydrogenase [Balneolales bacterium]